MTALKRLLGEGFRVFFLAAGLWAVLAMALWAVSLGAGWSLPGAMAPQYWHAHEMIFGYGGAALGGFFLTAVPNWTGAAAARHLFIGTVAGLWLAGRLAVALSGGLPPALVALACLSFLPVLGAKIATQLIRRPKPQNLLFLALLALVWLGEWRVQLDLLGLPWGDSAAGLRAGLYGLGAMIAVLGGRVTPAFTRNALIRQTLADTGTEPAPAALPHTRKPFDPLAILLSVAVVVAVLAGLPDALSAVLMLGFALAQLVRMRHWRSDFALRQPILWALHLSFLGLALGYAMTGTALLGVGPEIGALHVTAIAGIGGMTLAVMSRATLGHAGRPLIAPRAVVWAYALLPVATVLRWIAAVAPDLYLPAIVSSALAWCVAFGLYVAALWPAFWQPRLPRTGGAQ